MSEVRRSLIRESAEASIEPAIFSPRMMAAVWTSRERAARMDSGRSRITLARRAGQKYGAIVAEADTLETIKM
jgi:hypothetical protein